MSGPQNGVNGSLPHPSYGYASSQYSINNQIQRNHNQSMFGYPEMQQVVSNQYLSQGYSTSAGLNTTNNIRPMSPMVASPQYTYYQFPPQTNFQQYQYPPSNYAPQSQYIYSYDAPSQPIHQPVTYPTITRKLIPLVVVDPTNNTDLDLSKYQSQTVAEKKSKELIDSQKLIPTEVLLSEEIKTPEIYVDSRKELDIRKEVDIPCTFIEQEIPQIDILMNNEDINDNVQDREIRYTEEIIESHCDNREKEIIDDKKDESLEEMGKANIVEDKNIELMKVVEIETKINNTQESIYVDVQTIILDKSKPSYFLPINRKESDETTLKRKLTYDREFLILLKGNSRCKTKPLNLPPTDEFSEEIIYNESQNISLTKMESSPPTQLVSDRYNKKQAVKFQVTNNRRYVRSAFQPKLITLDLNENQVLERSKSSYLPPQLRLKDKEVDPYVDLKRNIKSNLNKITPQNFQDCLLDISKLNIKENDEMSCLISEIFTKAVQEEAYSVTYAQFCKKLSDIYSQNNSFKSQLLKKCQDMFQTPIQEQLENVRKEWVLKIDIEDDQKMKTLYQSDLEEQVKRAKDRYFGNIRFIGELFLHQLLAGKVILSCIIELLKTRYDTDALLALCKLMETCGKQIDLRNKEQMNGFIRDMNELSKSNELETRIRFKLKDVVDMRQRDWALRHIQQEKKINPKTIEEQKEEAAAEIAQKLATSQIQNKKSHHNTQNSPVVRRQITSQSKTFAVKALSVSSHVMDEKTVLGPARGNWVVGSGSKQKQRDSDLYSNLSQKYVSQSPDLSPQIKIKNRYRTLDSSAEGSGADSRSSTPPITHSKNVNKAHNSKIEVESMTDDERADIIFNDLLLTGKFDTENWNQIVDVKPIIEKWVDDMMEKDSSCRRCVGDSFAKLIKEKSITPEQLIAGTYSFVSSIDDLIYDIPKLWDFFAEFLERFICDKNSDISFFESIFKSLFPNENVALCLSKAMHAASSRLGHNIVGQVFYKSSLKWEHIVPNNWSEFVIEHDLQFTTVGGARLSQFGGFPLQSITDDLVTMLSEDVSNEDIFDYLEKHIDKPTWKNSECTRTITSCILTAMKSTPKSKARGYLKDKSDIIRQISQNKWDNEIEILRSVLNVANQLDKEILTLIYDVIMTGKIVSNDVFEYYLSDASFKSDSNFDLTVPIISQLFTPHSHLR